MTPGDDVRAALAEAERSRDHYRELYDAAPVAYLTLDRDGAIVEANVAAAALVGVGRRLLIGRPLTAFMPEDGHDAFRRHCHEVLATGGRMGRDHELLTVCGRVVPVHIDAVAYADDDGALSACRCVILDTSSVRRTFEALQAQESRCATLLDTAIEAIITVDSAGRIEAFNRAAERLFGYTEREVQGLSISALIPTLSGQRGGETLRHLSAVVPRSIDDAGQELTGRRRDGTAVPIELCVGQWCDRGAHKLTAFIRCIAERKRVEAELRESEARFRQIAENSADMFYIYERASGRISYASRAFETILGRSLDVFRAGAGVVEWQDWIHPEDRDRVARAFERMLEEGAPFDEECRICRPDGSIRWVRARAFPVEGEGGAVVRDVGVVQDVTGERELEEELRQAQKMEAVGALASGIAHDFNNVLQVIVGCINLALSEGVSIEQARNVMRRAANAALRGGDLAGQLMAFTRKRKADPRPLVVDRLIADSTELLQRLVTERVALTVELNAPNSQILADSVQVEQMLMNLAANARDAMPEGGSLSIETGEVVLDEPMGKHHAARRAGRYVRMVVRDTGVGMDDETRARIFEPFFTTKPVGKGTGLGLATVFSVIRQLRGHITVDSAVGEGTTFSLYLPCSERRVPEPTARVDRWKGRRLSGTALLVEDEPLVRLTVRHYLEELGLDVLEAADVDDAQRVCAAYPGRVDLLISDVILPGMLGPKLADVLQRRYSDLRVLFISANSRGLLEDEGTVAPHKALLQKPFSRDELAAKLTDLMSPEGSAAHSGPVRAPGERADRTILLVEDEPASHIALGELLESLGYRVIAVSTPAQAVEAAAGCAEPIHVLLADVQLSGMSAQELAERLRRTRRDLRVVLMSGGSERPAGASAFVHKPVDLDALVATIEGVLAPPDVG